MRKRFDHASRQIPTWAELSKTFQDKACMGAAIIQKIEADLGSESAGVATAALIEIIIDTDGPVKAHEFVKILISITRKIENLSTIRPSQVADLFAIYLHSVGKFVFPDNGLTPSPEAFQASVELFSVLANLIGIPRVEQSYHDFVDKIPEEILSLWLWFVLINETFQQLEVADLYAILKGRYSSSPCLIHEEIGQFLLCTKSFL